MYCDKKLHQDSEALGSGLACSAVYMVRMNGTLCYMYERNLEMEIPSQAYNPTPPPVNQPFSPHPSALQAVVLQTMALRQSRAEAYKMKLGHYRNDNVCTL